MGTPIAFEKLANVRDVGGMSGHGGRRVRTGMLLRGDQLFPASEHDLLKLKQIGVSKVIDLRSVGEHEEKPDPRIEGAVNVFLPIIEDVGVGITRGTEGNRRLIELLKSGQSIEPAFIDEHMRGMYRTFVEDPFANAQYARFFDEVIAAAEEGGGVYWHCTGGKDRAGFATVVLLAALGVSRDDIVADYMQTNESLTGIAEQFMSLFSDALPDDGTREATIRFFVANESYLAAALDSAEKAHGSFDAFLSRALKVDDAKRQHLHDLLLQD